MTKRLVMVGNGMAAVACLDRILDGDPSWQATVIGEEPRPGYNRILLSSVLAGECAAGETITHDLDWYHERRIDLRTGLAVHAIDRDRRWVVDASGNQTAYDRLVLATGSAPFVPPIEGADLDGVHAFRDLADAETLIAECRNARRAVVIGGGLLGLEAARGIARRKVETTVVHRMPWLMERQLDAPAGALLRDAMQDLGIRILLQRETAALRAGDEAGRIGQVVLQGGETLEADFVVIAAGIRPRIELARSAGLDVGRGIQVDDHMRTSDQTIYAVGECAEHRGQTYGLVAPLYEQGQVLAGALNAEAAGEELPAGYSGSLVYSKLKVAGVNVFSVGEFSGEKARGDLQPAAATAEALRVEDAGAGLYRKVVMRKGRVVGAILMGSIDDASRLVNLVSRQTPVKDPAERRALLLGSLAAGHATAGAELQEEEAVAALAEGANVCGCMGVSKREIVAAIESGAWSLEEIKQETRASTSCGSCAGSCQALLRVTRGEAGDTPEGAKPLCACVPHPMADLRRMIKTQQLKSVSEVLRIYGNAEGCAICHPALAFLVDEIWLGDHVEERRSRFINDRVHANIQKDGSFSVVPRMRGGVTTPDQLRRIADAAEKYGARMVKVTGGQRIDLLGLRKQDLPSIWKDLGMASGHAYAKAVRTVKTCVGTEFCRFGVGNSTSLGIALEESTEGLYTPAKVKMGVSGCPRNCAEVTVKDIGITAIQGGWEVAVGGAGGMRVRRADLLARVDTAEEALRVSHLFLQYYRENANYLERTYDFVERFGFARVRAETVEAASQVQAEILERFRRAKTAAVADPWAKEREKNATANQFGELPPLEFPR